MQRPFKIVLFIVLMGHAYGYPQNGLPNPKNGNTYVIAHKGAHNGIQTDQPKALIKFISSMDHL
ncbi:hypothetical protein [Arenibacter troitsensis]|uniref:Glycerophosphoryl diester phosphodiesterase family protein n=1 Tax=Arenibacter troitsensis TaxID=188872 RepID=A0A1X7JHN2_9FLAO|nr:hypothetical protein [Arenibacter troitsensis]SMG27412.1 hypothetical protein SAMN03080602_01858 [Arenibacter troitsensis]